ncbi:MAG: hypothetical protein ACFB2W_01545 [Leptolyngbyaceae cyanobacterium]
MQRLLLVLLITAGAISLSGCGFFNRGNDAAEESTTPEEQSAQTVETAEGQLPTVKDGEDSDSVVEATPNSPTVVARDLIRSTDPNERAIGVERTRSDPFAGLTIPLVPPQPIEVPGTTAANGGAQTGGANGRVAAQGNGGAAAGTTSAQAQGRPGVENVPQLASDRPDIAALPAIPQPTNARAVRVSGVIQVGGESYAIVKAPNEVERYVRPGERIAGGSVVVKRIDTRSTEPRVILVENGIEVERLVTATEEPVEEIDPEAPAEAVSAISALPTLPSPGI